MTVVSAGQLPIGRGGSARLSSTNRIMGRATTDRSLPNGEYHTFSRTGLHRTCLKRAVECIFVSGRVETMGSRAAPSGSTPFCNTRARETRERERPYCWSGSARGGESAGACPTSFRGKASFMTMWATEATDFMTRPPVSEAKLEKCPVKSVNPPGRRGRFETLTSQRIGAYERFMWRRSSHKLPSLLKPDLLLRKPYDR